MLAVVLINLSVVATVVLIHYGFLYGATLFIPKLKVKHHYRIVAGVFTALAAHAIEVWVFALAFYSMHHEDGWGRLTGAFSGSLLDCVYFSFTVFTTLGFGDIVPSGDLRYTTGIESLTGLVLITWTASFLYLEMRSQWARD